MADRPAGINDVARLAQVSPATVSRSLRGLPHVSEATRLKVLEAATALSYVASPAASRLAGGRTGTIGVVVPYVTRWFFAQAVAGVERVVREAGYDVLLYNISDVHGRDHFLEAMPLRGRVDAVVVVTLSLTDAQAERLQRIGVPVVTVGTRTPLFSSVTIDEASSVRLAVRHLHMLGHESVTMIASPPDDLAFVAAEQRRLSFLAEAADHGMRSDIVYADSPGVEGGANAAHAVLASQRVVTAVFAEYDELALGALRTFVKAGAHVPDQVSLIGFDDHDIASVVDLTTIMQPVREQGEAAARLLLDDLRRGEHEPRRIELPTRLAIRATTARPTGSARTR